MKVCVIVDGYGAAQPLPRAFNERGFACVHVKTTPRLDPLYRGRFNPEDYALVLDYSGNPDELAEDIIAWASAKGHQIAVAIPGMEPGVELADLLSEKLGLDRRNGTALSAARRNKFLMHETLKAAGVPSIKQFKSKELAPLLAWVRENLTYPLILKPLDSAGIDGVTLCHDEEEVRSAFYNVIGKVNLMGQENNEVLAQEYIRGEEYVVNHVSCAGKHQVVEIWRSAKIYVPGVGIIYDREELLPFDGKLQDELKVYMLKVLDALGIEYGPTHAELKYDGRPMLIEVAARISGVQNPKANDVALGHNMVDMTADAYADPQRWAEKAAAIGKLNKRCWIVVVPSRQEGTIDAMPFTGEIERLPSFFSAAWRVRPGGALRKTVDLNTCVGLVFLMDEDEEVIYRDYQRIMALVPEGFILKEKVEAIA